MTRNAWLAFGDSRRERKASKRARELMPIEGKAGRVPQTSPVPRTLAPREDKVETYLSRKYAALLEDPDCYKLDWFDVALRRLGGITKAAKLIRVSASRLEHYRDRGWSSLTSDQMMKVAQASGVPILGLMVQCNEELAAQGQPNLKSNT